MSDPTTRYDRAMLTVIYRNEAPWAANEPATYRTVHIKLTEEQQKELAVQGNPEPHSGATVWEQISHCFLEPERG